MRIIDCHCHAGKGNGLSGPWDTSAPLSRFLKWSAKAGIKQTNLFAAFRTDGYAQANAEVAKSSGQTQVGSGALHLCIRKQTGAGYARWSKRPSRAMAFAASKPIGTMQG